MRALSRRVSTPLWSVAVLFVLTVVVGVANLLFTTSQVDTLRAQQQAACAFAADLGSAPFPSSPRPSKLGVSIVADSRSQWRKLHCPGTLPVSPGLIKWGHFYRIPVS